MKSDVEEGRKSNPWKYWPWLLQWTMDLQHWHCLFLAPTGAQGVTMSVRPSVRHNMLRNSLEQSIFIFLGPRAIREHSESNQEYYNQSHTVGALNTASCLKGMTSKSLTIMIIFNFSTFLLGLFLYVIPILKMNYDNNDITNMSVIHLCAG